jgi:hypothetical protein
MFRYFTLLSKEHILNTQKLYVNIQQDWQRVLTMSNTLEEKGISYVLEYETKKGREPLDLSRKREVGGFDILSKGSDNKPLKIEVKSSFGKGIPYTYESEFTSDQRFVATHLCVVCFDKKLRILKLCI